MKNEFRSHLCCFSFVFLIPLMQDLELTHPGPVSVLGPGRCKRFAMHVVDGVIKAVNVSEGPNDPVRTSVIYDENW